MVKLDNENSHTAVKPPLSPKGYPRPLDLLIYADFWDLGKKIPLRIKTAGDYRQIG
jgi:hypothetical protein